jgi:hypothetical protein
MGLDLIEFEFALEDAFGIYIPDSVANGLKTPAMVIAYLDSRLDPSGSSHPCLEQRAFYRLRRAVQEVLDRPRAMLTPATTWREVLHPEQQARQWKLLEQTVGLQPWPKLKPLFGDGAIAETMGDTSQALAVTSARSLLRDGEGWSKSSIRDVVHRLIGLELGISDYQPDDEFVRDLGCG